MKLTAVPPPEVAENIALLKPYIPGKPIDEVKRELGVENLVKLASNENPLGPSPMAVQAISKMASTLHTYPDASSHALRSALSSKLMVDPECLVFGNGSDDILHLLGVTFLEPGDQAVQPDPSFARYEAAALLNGSLSIKVPLSSDWNYNIEAMLSAITPKTRILFLCNPNNPTGTMITESQMERILEHLPERAILALDEAYYEYAVSAPGYPDSLRYVREERNLVILRTFSKAYGLAGLRIGYGIMRPQISRWLERTREPFNVNSLAQAAAAAALDDVQFVRRTQTVNEEGKAQLYSALDQMGMSFTPTFGNFLWVDLKQDGRSVYESLLRCGVIVRFINHPRAASYIRVTIGTREENERFLQALFSIIKT